MKIIIWGHKIHSHTHSYIHAGFYDAFKYMGYDTYWFDDKDDISDFNFENSLFLTEGQVDKNIPLRKDCFYVLHNCNFAKYQDLKHISIQVYTLDGRKRYFSESSPECYEFFKDNTLYFCWPTNLLPHEINTDQHFNDTSLSEIYWIGTLGGGVHGNINELTPFINRAKARDKTFIHSDPWSKPKTFEENCSLIRKSFLAPAIVGTWQKEKHYIPCRIFKNISYGKLGLTNSLGIKRLFGDHVTYAEDTSLLFDLGEEKLKTISFAEMKDAMEFVKINHTYINRCNSILRCLDL